jgi:hypothetical protein
MLHDAFTEARWDELWGDTEPVYDPSAEPQLGDSLALITGVLAGVAGRSPDAGCGPWRTLSISCWRRAGCRSRPVSECSRAAHSEFERRGVG